MFEPNSRYANVETASLTVATPTTDEPDGVRVIAYKRRRFLPPLETAVILMEHQVQQGERLDNITARYLGDPTLFWQICDANLTLRPEALTETPNSIIHIALPRLG